MTRKTTLGEDIKQYFNERLAKIDFIADKDKRKIAISELDSSLKRIEVALKERLAVIKREKNSN